MQFTQRQRLFGGTGRVILAAMLVGLMLGFAGPFGSYPAFPTTSRYAFWIGLTVAGVIAALAANAMLPLAKLRAGAIRTIVVALISALPMTFVVAWTMSLIQPDRNYAPQQLLGLYWGVAAVQLLIVYVTSATADSTTDPVSPSDAQGASKTEAAANPATFPAALLSRLPAAIGREIIALETEDHYLRVHTLAGSALILMRMADAVALLDPALGAQVHRRWWIAQRAVAGVQNEGQRLSFRLIDGRVIPLGRTFSASARTTFAKAFAKVAPAPSSMVVDPRSSASLTD